MSGPTAKELAREAEARAAYKRRPLDLRSRRERRREPDDMLRAAPPEMLAAKPQLKAPPFKGRDRNRPCPCDCGRKVKDCPR